MEQRHRFRTAREIARFKEKADVGNKQRRQQRRLGQFRKITGKESIARGAQHKRQHHHQRRQYPPRAPLIKAKDRKPPRVHLTRDDARDQKARDDEEDVNPNIAAGKQPKPRMIKDHRQNRDRTQPVDVGAVSIV